jgi:N-acetyl-gamma-glutamyl-phosphate reductase
MTTIRVAIIGPTGYTAYELLRLLHNHGGAKVVALAGRREENPPIDQIFPALTGLYDLKCENLTPVQVAERCDVAFACMPHGAALEYGPVFAAAGKKLIDLSPDYRLRDPAVFEKWYKLPHTDKPGLASAVYGLPELFREPVKKAKLLANPGCYPTASALAIAPLLKAGLADLSEPIVVDAASGISGAGRKASEAHHFPERNEAFAAYNVGAHRHMPEIEQTCAAVAGKPVEVIFTPHLIPADRGILATVYIKPTRKVETAELRELFAATYQGEKFIRLRTDSPNTKHVAGTNFCDIAVWSVKGRIVVVSAIDNLVKGASGQAIQNMNLMFGLDEAAGLL